MEKFAYEMKCYNDSVEKSDIVCSSFEVEFFQEYMRIYNECFYEMRKSLDVKPYNFLKEYNQIADRVKDIYLLVKHGEIIGSIACYDNEIDDLIVNKKFRRKGYGKQLLLWGMQHIREKSNAPITLHVAKWNKNAIMLYKKAGFEIANVEKVR